MGAIKMLSRLGGGGLLPETLAYKVRVEDDGGIISDVAFVEKVFRFCKQNSILANGLVGISSLAGIKVISGRVVKRYNFFSSNDEYQDSESLQYEYVDNDDFFIKSVCYDESKSSKIASIQFPTYIDVFITGSFAKQWMIEHSANATANDGFNFWGGKIFNNWYVNRSGGQSAAAQTYEWGIGRCVNRFIYNATNRKVYRNKVEIPTTISGTLRANSNVTSQLNLFSRNQNANFALGRNKDLFIFSELSKTVSDDFENFLYNNTITDIKTDFNLLADGDSLNVDWLAATTSHPYELASNICTSGKNIITNVAVAGQKSDSTGVLSNLQTHLDAAYNAALNNNIFTLLVGINDLLASQTPSNIYANILTAVGLANAKGFKSFVFTNRLIANTSVTTGINDLNTLIRNGSGVDGFTVIDVASNPLWNDQSETSNLDYYLDGLHLTNKAHRIFAKMAYDIILPQLI